ISRVPFAPNGEDTAAASRGAAAKKRLASLGSKASGADWVDASLASARVGYEFLSALRRDARGALDRLAAVPDGSPEEKSATGLLAFVLRSPGFAALSEPGAKPNDAQVAKREADSLKAHAAHLAEAGAPRWFTRTAAAYVLAEHPKPPPAWATAATADAIASGETSSLDALPEDVLTPELAALASAFDRDRIDRVEREHPDVARSLEAMFGLGEDVDAGSLAFHVPAGRFAEELLSCLRGAGPLRFSAAVQALAVPAWNETQRRTIERGVRGEVYPFAGELPPADDTATARVAAALGAARRSEDAAVRAGVQILSPLYGLPLDSELWSRDVVSRPSAAALALPYLELDRGLPRREWTRLFAATLAGARSESRDPFACATRDFRFSPWDAEAPRDGYCTLIRTLFQYGLDEDDPDRPGSSRASEIAEFTRSSAAPPEVHLHAKLGRALTGKASDAEVLELWHEKDLPWSVRQMVVSSFQGAPSTSLASEWLRELREGRLSASEEAVLLSAARRTEPAEAGRLAARRFEEGRVPLGGTDGRAKAWIEA
ncbi:MAG TPA: hypothetical protein VGR00_01340, partial [Thermoanaerobaculia bacterium]|nr:hypothetical protein [Thermoanaerobaculia bacterium]